MANCVKELDDACGPLLEAAAAVGAKVWVVSEYGHLQVGSEIDSGIYTEDRAEFAINTAPILFRVNFP